MMNKVEKVETMPLSQEGESEIGIKSMQTKSRGRVPATKSSKLEQKTDLQRW